MRALNCVGSIDVLMSGGVVLAQSGTQPATGPMYRGAPIGDVKARIAHCLKDCDAKTHMTEQEWERTCQRVTENQNKFLQEHA